jgi:hypothetical protein
MAEAKSAEWTDPAEIRAQADRLVAEGKKAIALKSWEEGVAKYADALDLMYVELSFRAASVSSENIALT